MLKLAKDFDGLTQIDLMLAMHIARCPDTGAYMGGSNGRRKAGRPRRYWARRGETLVRFTAHSDEEALAKANQRLFPEIIEGKMSPAAEPGLAPLESSDATTK